MLSKIVESPIIVWNENHIQSNTLPYSKTRKQNFYNSCFVGPLLITVGDFVLIENDDVAVDFSKTQCNIAKILHMYESFEISPKKKIDPYRAIVEWYSRCSEIPDKFMNHTINFNYQYELVQDLRLFDTDISIETIFNKCSIVFGKISNSPDEILKENMHKKNKETPLYVCRYKLIRRPGLKGYSLVPLDYNSENLTKSHNKEVITPKRKIREFQTESPKDMYCVVRLNDVMKDDEKITPIKIIKNIDKLSKYNQELSQNEPKLNQEYYEPNDYYLDDLKSTQDNSSPMRKKAKRKLSMESEISNYSIINDNNDCIKIKLKKNTQNDDYKSNLEKIIENEITTPVRRSTRKLSQNNILREITPSKINKELDYGTPTVKTRRRSILKLPGSAAKSDSGTPRKTLKLSNVIEAYSPDYIPKTPVNNLIESDEEFTPVKKSIKKNDKEEILKTPKSNKKDNKSTTSGSRRKLINEGIITPNIAKKEIKINTRKSEIQIARERLHVAATPKSLPCRETEFDNIYSFLERKICDKSSGCMYVSGVPGTGKTATVTEVIRCLKEESNANEIPDFQYIEINGMRLTEPQQAYVQIYYQLSGKIVASRQAYNLLQKRYTTSSPKRVTTILIIDELDIICNRRQDVVYNLLDWSTKQIARLVIIAIANTMDLPERMLVGKVTSRLGLTRLTFLPYTFKQLQEIVTARLSGINSFKSDAIQLVARKIAAVSGDARRALDICRRATEIADYTLDKTETTPGRTKAIVNLFHVQQALGEMISSGKIQAIKNCSELEKLFLQAVSAEVIRTGVEETVFNDVYSQLETLTAFASIGKLPSIGIVMKICSKLSDIRLLICEHSRADIYRKILLNVSSDDIHFALQTNLD